MNLFLMATSLEPDTSPIFTVTVIVAGLGIVLATLAFLIFVFNVFGKLVSSSQKRAEQKKIKKQPAQAEDGRDFPDISLMPAFEIPFAEEQTENGVSPEVVAAISAAIYSVEGNGAKITSIKRKSKPVSARSAWAQAAVINNTQPF